MPWAGRIRGLFYEFNKKTDFQDWDKRTKKGYAKEQGRRAKNIAKARKSNPKRDNTK